MTSYFYFQDYLISIFNSSPRQTILVVMVMAVAEYAGK